MTDRCSRARRYAAIMPASPAPTMQTSTRAPPVRGGARSSVEWKREGDGRAETIMERILAFARKGTGNGCNLHAAMSDGWKCLVGQAPTRVRRGGETRRNREILRPALEIVSSRQQDGDHCIIALTELTPALPHGQKPVKPIAK